MAAYRGARVTAVRMVSVAFVGHGSSVIEGSDGGMLDVVGCDTAAPALIGDFLRDAPVAADGRPATVAGEDEE